MTLDVPNAHADADALNPIDLMLSSSGVVLVVLLLLIVASTLVWVVWVAKWLQLRRLTETQRQVERESSRLSPSGWQSLAEQKREAPGSSVLLSLAHHSRDESLTLELLQAASKRAIAAEEQRASSLMPTLSSIAAASPFIGLFGTVWGIMDAFLRIGVEKSASLPVVAPAIGEALIATAFGLVAAIPAVIAYNYVDRRISELLDELGAAADVWVAQLYAFEMRSRAQGTFDKTLYPGTSS